MKNIFITPQYQLINSDTQLTKALKPFLNSPKIAIDCETTGLNPYQAKIRTIQLAIPNHPVLIIDLFTISKPETTLLKNLFTNSALKIGHNLKFEWIMLTMAGLNLSSPFFDTYLAYQVLNAGLNKTASLQAISDELLNIKLNKTQQNSNWRNDLNINQLQYAATDAAILLPLYQKLANQLQQAQLQTTAKIEFACLVATAMMELNGIYLNQNQWHHLGQKLIQKRYQLLETINQQLKLPETKQKELFSQFISNINPRSPQQVLTALHHQGIKVSSTNTEALIPLAKEYPIIQTLLDYRSLSTRISTFNEKLTNYINPITQRIHPNWFQIGARSGRFSCRKPNLQNIPRNKETRACFRAEKGNLLIKADYSQIELRIMALITGDKQMCQAFRQGEDLHKLTAALVLEKAIAEITKEERQLGKIINFGLLYGMGVKKFQHTAAKDYSVEMTQTEASQFRRKFFDSYPAIKQYHHKTRQKWIQGVKESYTLSGRRRLWGQQNQPTLNELINHPVQGTNSDITKLALALAAQCFQKTEIKIIAAIHDEIILESPNTRVKWAIAKLKKCMIKAGNYFIAPIPVEVEIQAISSWGGD